MSANLSISSTPSSGEPGVNPNPIQKRKRKVIDTSRENEAKTFVCHCGKIYLSYPGLYIHRKNKHQQSFETSHCLRLKRLTHSSPNRDNRASGIPFTQEDRQIIEGPLNLGHLQQYLKKFVSYAELNKIQDGQAMNDARVMMNYWEFNCKEHEPRACGLFTTPVYFVLGHFLRALEESVDSSFHPFLQWIMINFSQAICDFYKNKAYTKSHSAHPLPLLMNHLAISVVNKTQGEKHGQEREKGLCIVCLILLFFCRWIKQEGFTEISLKLNLA